MSTCITWFNHTTYFCYLVLIPGLIIICIFQLDQRIKDGVFKILLPFKILENNDRNRMALALGFGSLSGNVISEVLGGAIIDVFWPVKPFLYMLFVISIAVTAYPLFICIHSSHVRLSSLLGAGYLIAYLLFLALPGIKKSCLDANGDGYAYYAEIIPDVICIVLLFAIFIKRLFSGHKYPSFHHILLPHQKKYVRRLWNPSQYLQNPGNFYERYIWNKDPYFHYPAVVLIPTIVLLMLCYKIFFILQKSLIMLPVPVQITAIITVVIFVVQILFFLKSFKKDFRNVLKYGQICNNPHRMTKSEILLKHTLFPGYFIAFNVFGALVIFAMFYFIFLSFDSVLNNPTYDEKILRNFGKGIYTFIVGSVVVMIAQHLTARFVFTANIDKNDRMSVNHFNFYHLNMYLTVFLNLPIGFMSFLWTSIVSLLANVFFLPRFDLLMMNPKYFARINTGHRTYQAAVTLEAMYKNPTMRCFCHLLLETATYGECESDTLLNEIRRRLPNCLAKNRWFLAVTLMKNPCLAQYRKRKIYENCVIDEQI